MTERESNFVFAETRNNELRKSNEAWREEIVMQFSQPENRNMNIQLLTDILPDCLPIPFLVDLREADVISKKTSKFLQENC